MKMSKIKFKTSMNKLRYYLSYLLLGFYLVVGTIFLFSDVWADFIPAGRPLIGLLLILFGVFRFYVSYKRYLNKNLKLELLLSKNENVK